MWANTFFPIHIIHHRILLFFSYLRRFDMILSQYISKLTEYKMKIRGKIGNLCVLKNTDI